MKKSILAFCCFFIIISCSRYQLPSSKYAGATRFEYKAEQPVINFVNKELDVMGAWWWGSMQRAMPNPNFLPDTIRRILKPMTKQHGKVLFATFSKERKKFMIPGFVPVSRSDVRSNENLQSQSYITVLFNEHRFDSTDHKYSFKGKTGDYQFNLYQSKPVYFEDNWIIMEVIAASRDNYFNFISVFDKSLAKSESSLQYHSDLFYEDAKNYFGRIDDQH